MSSTQSQEAIASIDAELSTILKKDYKTKDEEDEASSTDTDTELKWGEDSDEDESSRTGKRHKGNAEGTEMEDEENITGKKRRSREDQLIQESQTESPSKSPKFLNSSPSKIPLSLDLDDLKDMPISPATSRRERPVMERTKSLDKITKFPPTKIIRVCIEKTTQLLDESFPNGHPDPTKGPRDYKKVKYWLKIAQKMSTSIERATDFTDFLTTVRNNYGKNDKALMQLLDETFPKKG